MNGQNGSILTSGGFWLCALAFLAGVVLLTMQPTGAEEAANVMQAALPLGDATVIEYEHAVAQHSTEALAVRECLNNGGMFAIWQKPDGRFVRLCQLEDGKFGMQICQADYDPSKSCFHEITSYIKNKFTGLDQLLRYLKKMGATQVWP